MKFAHTLLTFIFITAFSVLLHSQENAEDPNVKLDKKYTPNQNSVFSITAKRKGGSESSAEITIRNLIKFCPTALFRQKALLYYDFDLIDGLALTAGIGKSFGEDYLQKIYLTGGFGDLTSPKLSLYTLFDNATYTGSSIFLSGGLKYYFSGKTFDENFMAFNYSRERMDYTLNATIDNRIVTGDDKVVSFKVNSFSFGYGFTSLSGPRNNFCHEFFMGCGVRFINYSEIDMMNNVSGPYAPNPTYYKTGAELKTRIFPSVNISYLFGFGF